VILNNLTFLHYLFASTSGHSAQLCYWGIAAADPGVN